MIRSLLGRAAIAAYLAAYLAADFAVLVAPALALRLTAQRSGMGGVPAAANLLVGSAVLATIHAGVSGVRLERAERRGAAHANLWLAAINALVVLALAMPLLLMVVLTEFADEHASLADRDYPVLALWLGIQVASVVLAEVTGRVVFWWLDPHPDHGPRGSPLRPGRAR